MGQTLINHDIRVKLKLNCLEYCVADYIANHKIQNTLEPCAEYLGISLAQANVCYSSLCDKYLMMLNGVGVDLEVTDKWKNEFKKANPIDDKVKAFANSLVEHQNKYSAMMIAEFFNYWSELNPSKTKMRWQLEKTWDVSKRLARWYNNNNKGGVSPVKDKTEYIIK